MSQLRIIGFGVAIASIAASLFLLRSSAASIPTEDLFFGLWRMRHILVVMALLIAAIGALCLAAGRGVWMGFWASLIPVIVIFAVLELIGRAGLIDWSSLLTPQQNSGEAVGWALQPDVVVSGQTGQDIAARLGLPHDPIPFEFRADGYGFRNGDEPAGNIIFLGDSIVLGAAVPAEQTLTEVAEDVLGKPVMQAALLGLSIQAQHDMLRQVDLPLRGKTVVQFLFEGNDLLDSRAHGQDGPTGTSDANASFLRLIWAKLTPLTNPAAPYYTCDIDGQQVAFLWTRRSFEGVEDELDAIMQSVMEFQNHVTTQGGQYAMVFVPTKFRTLYTRCQFSEISPLRHPERHLSGLPEAISVWSQTRDIPLFDLTDALRGAAQSSPLPWFWGDTHLNSDGHRVAGHAVATWIDSLVD